MAKKYIDEKGLSHFYSKIEEKLSVQSDYEQSDSTQPDYIKNRTHYKEIIHQGKVDLLPATEIDFSSLGDRGYSQPEPLNIQVGDKVKVLWGSQEYECVAQSTATLDPEGNIGLPSDGIAFGNLYYLFEVTDDSRNMPFCAIANYTMSEQGEIISGYVIMRTSELTNPITVNIFTEEDKVVYHKLDVNYLPIFESGISSDENNIVTSKPLLNYLSANRPDWDVSDRDAPRFIKNRPFYRDLWGSTGMLFNRIITLDETGLYTSEEQLYNFNDIWDNSYGDINLTVYWHDGTYNCKLRKVYTGWTDEYGEYQSYDYFAFGNVSDIDYDYRYDSAPFLIYIDFNPETHKIGETYIKAYDGFTGELTLQVDAEYRYWGYITLDNRYLNLTESVSENSKNPVTSGAVYNAIQSANEAVYTELNKKANADSIYTKTEIDNKLGSVFHYKGTVDSYSDLPSANEVGDVWNIVNAYSLGDINIKAGDNVAWTGTDWDILSGTVDLSAYALGNHTHNTATTSANGFISSGDKAKLDTVEKNANAYTHPLTHPASMIEGLATVATSGSYNDLSGAPKIDKTLSETSTDENVPSSKCVYDAIQAAIGNALGGSY